MILNDIGELGGICGYCKSRYEARKHKRRSSEPVISGQEYPYARLSKPPKVQSLHERPRNRLQKRALASPHTPTPVTLYILEYESYPYNTRPSAFLGVYSTLDSVTSGALQHGAYSFSKEGLLDGTEYLSPTGRIKIISEKLQRDGVAVGMPGRAQSMTSDHVRLDIPHPEHQQNHARSGKDAGETVYLAIHQEPRAAFCIGVFAKKSLAWGACVKNKASLALKKPLYEETRVCVDGLPSITARVFESGRHSWFVASYTIDTRQAVSIHQ